MKSKARKIGVIHLVQVSLLAICISYSFDVRLTYEDAYGCWLHVELNSVAGGRSRSQIEY